MKKTVLTITFSITVLIGMAQTQVRPLNDGHRINRIQEWVAKNNATTTASLTLSSITSLGR